MLSIYLCQFAISLLLYGGLGLAIGLVICMALLGKENYVSKKRKVMFVLFFVYAACVLTVTVMPLIGEYAGDDGAMHVGFIMEYSHMRSLNIIPFAMIRGAMHRNALTRSVSGGLSLLYAIRSIEINLYGNILMFVPIGFLFPFTHQKRHMAWDIFFLALFSFSIEFVQYLTGRSADIDDIILNWIGGLLGFGIFHLLYFFHNRNKNQKML